MSFGDSMVSGKLPARYACASGSVSKRSPLSGVFWAWPTPASTLPLRSGSPTRLEASEALEQLRAVENGIRIFAVETRYDSIGVDTPDDLERVRRLIPGALRV